MAAVHDLVTLLYGSCYQRIYESIAAGQRSSVSARINELIGLMMSLRPAD